MEDDFYPRALELARSNGGISVSMLQRVCLIGYTRAWQLVEKLDKDGLLGPQKNGSAMRDYIGTQR